MCSSYKTIPSVHILSRALTSILTKYQYTYQVSVIYWYLYLVFIFPNTDTDTSYFKNVLEYWYFQYFSVSVFLKIKENKKEIITRYNRIELWIANFLDKNEGINKSKKKVIILRVYVTPFIWANLIYVCVYSIIFMIKYWYWIVILQYFLDIDTASVFFRLSTDTDTSVF